MVSSNRRWWTVVTDGGQSQWKKKGLVLSKNKEMGRDKIEEEKIDIK